MFPVVVVQLTVRESSPDTHSALMSVYTLTVCDPPSLDTADSAKYEKGMDCLRRSVG